MERRGIRVEKEDVRIDKMIEMVKESEEEGYEYEGEEESFEIMERGMINKKKELLKVE